MGAGMQIAQIVLVLVGVATVVAVFARRLAVPAPSLLVVAGLLIGFVPGMPPVHITPEIISVAVLPPLLYAAGEELSVPQLRRSWRPVAVLAIGLVPASAAAVAFVAVGLTGLPLSAAFVLGAVLASTDPVAVTALGRRLSLPPRLLTLVQAESLFNDATSLILFRIAATVAVSGVVLTWGRITLEFVILALGGAAVGAVVGALVAWLRTRTEDPVTETVITLITPYLAFVVAERLHASGVTAVVVASVILGGLAARLTTPATRLQLSAVHHTVVFVLESVVFALIGLQLPALIRGESLWWLLGAALVLTATLLIMRVAWVFPLSAFRHWRHVGVDRPLWQVPAVISWAGARGVVPLAAALSIPEDLPGHDTVLLLAVAVTVISLVVQGFTLAPLVRRAELAVPREDLSHEYRHIWARLNDVAHDHLEQLEDLQAVAPVVIEHTRQSLDARHAEIAEAHVQLRREVAELQTGELNRLYRAGEVSDAVRRRVQRELDIEAERFKA
jgi:CPA1 family monovalent cation:H+ antiporter